MSRGRYNAIGLLQAAEISLGFVHGHVIAALMQECRKVDLHLSVGQVDDAVLVDEAAMPNLLNAWAVDGLIISYVANYPAVLLVNLERYRIPAIWMNTDRSTDAICVDDYCGTMDSTRRLLELGHRKIGFVRYFNSSHYSCADRWRGYSEAMQAAGLSPHRLGFTITKSDDVIRQHDIGQDVGTWLGSSDVTAVVVDDDDAVPILVHACALKGIRLGIDLSVIRISREAKSILGQSVATAVIPTGDLGHLAVPMLKKKIESPTTEIPTVKLPFNFKYIDSSCRTFRQL